MTPFEMAAAVIVMAAVFTYLNYTLLRLPTAIGATGLTLVASLLLILVGLAVPRVEQYAGSVVQQIDLKQAFLNGMLGFMLFAGALHIDLRELAARRWPIAVLSTVGVLLSTAIVAGLVWGRCTSSASRCGPFTACCSARSSPRPTPSRSWPSCDKPEFRASWK